MTFAFISYVSFDQFKKKCNDNRITAQSNGSVTGRQLFVTGLKSFVLALKALKI